MMINMKNVMYNMRIYCILERENLQRTLHLPSQCQKIKFGSNSPTAIQQIMWDESRSDQINEMRYNAITEMTLNQMRQD